MLQKLCRENPALEVEKIDILLHPRQALRDGIRMIPALQGKHGTLSGIFLGEETIRRFVEEHLGSE